MSGRSPSGRATHERSRVAPSPPAVGVPNAAFTPGPWHYDRDLGNDGDYVRESAGDACLAMLIDGGHINPRFALPQSEIDANAHLIAAAPELYAALEEAERLLSNHAVHEDDLPPIRAALAKARGETA